jgi:transposase
MPKGRPLPPLKLTEDEKHTLDKLVRRRKTGQALARRARVILLCAQGMSNASVCREVEVRPHTVGRLRKRFLKDRLHGLTDLPRSGPPRRISDEQVAEVVRLTLETKPAKATHWSTRSMAARVGISNERVARIWKAFGLQPHRSQSFQLSTDPLFVEKVRDVVGLYMSPPQNALVLCVDEKSQIQALERSQPILPLAPGRAERHTHDYLRHGTLTLFAALEIKTGEVLAQCRARHTQRDFLAFLREIEKQTPKQLDVHMVLDNYAAHKTTAVRRWIARHPRWQLHFIPTHSSWLNQVERFFAKITTEQIRRNSFRSVSHLRRCILDYIEDHNRDPKPFKWTASADIILGKVEHLCRELA